MNNKLCYVVVQICWEDNREGSFLTDSYRESRKILEVFGSYEDARTFVEETAATYYDGQFEWLFGDWDYVWHSSDFYNMWEKGVRFSIKKRPYNP